MAEEKLCAICNVPQSQHTNSSAHGFVAKAPPIPDEAFGTITKEGLKQVFADPTGQTTTSDVAEPSPTEKLAESINNLADAIRGDRAKSQPETPDAPQPVTDV